jgi:hypothetical protein
MNLKWIISLVSCAAASLAIAASPPLQWPAVTDEPTHTHVPGRWATVDLFTDDVAAAERFYGKVFGWTFERFGDGKKVYALARSDGQRLGGVAYVEKARAANKAGRWIGMLSVPDVAAAAGHVAKAGGKVMLEPRDLPGRGKAALVSDPEGAPFGLIRTTGGDPVDELGDDDTWLWGELWARDPDAMAGFYKGLGFSPKCENTTEEPTEYFLMAGGYPRAGIIRSPRDNIPAVWLPYIRVASLAQTLERVTQAGGRVVLRPDPKIRGGRIAIFIDPVGAPVGIAEWADKVAE